MTPSTKARHYDTVIIGAGMSGLACASRLYQHPNFRQAGSLLVLEGRDRIGGRIGSVHVKGCRLDTGANWIHGTGTEEKPNPLVSILPHKRYRSLAGTVSFRRADDAAASDHEQDGGWVDVRAANSPSQQPPTDLVIPAETSGMMAGALWGMIGSLRGQAERTSAAKAKATSMLRAIIDSEERKNAYKDVPKKYHSSFGCMPQFVEGMEAAPLVAQSAEHPEAQPGVSLLEYALEDFEGSQVFLQDGYTAVIDEIAKDLANNGVIELNTEVQSLDWQHESVVIKTTTGIYTARQVVCTLPLGVLQHHQKQHSSESPLFKPALPIEMQEAVSKLGFGTLDKIFLVFDKPWWADEPYASILKKGLYKRPFDDEANDSEESGTKPPDNLMCFTDELAGVEIHADGTVTAGARVLFIVNLHNLTGFPVLSAFVSCANARHVEALSDDQAAGILHRSLTVSLGIEPPKPAAVHVTRWAQDPFSYGSYSHMITGLTDAEHRDVFKQPVVSEKGAVLRFAGEHTSRNHFATVHGALLSGWREADAILAQT
ncbi:hypothetical protein BAUCODRAFT_118878 [Baudoinia panamericana UAMH 10762]|uniref:Amine oxidase domain-containing protein n=1 Tax=Baudoinia panamericana (strain UAMH 10762) TaxID=717646 RepID=M2NNR6_BAUPA|nr:uncharacterized protein BAUCODRAFT_118878 [Baudoinia panamericana UAMH 10762]EMD01170.1 hypothetical protein BAUCODRAFT_118878 [Baudoinia panamericana UAMH 10762]